MSKKHVRWRRMNLPKIENIKISEKHIGIRAFAVGILILLAAISLGSALTDFLNTDPGWQSVEVESDTVNVSTEFHFSYDFSDYGGSASVAYKQLIQLYSRATEDAYRIFHEEVENLNSHVNEPVTVDEALYEALELIVDSGNRNIFLAPVYVEYSAIFLSGGSAEAAQYDPAQNPEMVPYISAVASFVNDPEMIGLELLGDCQVCLRVSDEYLAFAEENEIDSFVDLNWMTNAFVVDYLAQVMMDNGYTSGYIASYDGFTRNMDTRGNSYNFNLYDRQGFTIYPAAILQYNEPNSIVFLRNYPMDTSDWLHYYEFADGSVATVFIDPADGMSKAAFDNLVSYSGEHGCAEILMKMIPTFICEADDSSVFEAVSDGVYTIWFEDLELRSNQADANLSLTEKGEEAGYIIVN